MRIIQTKVKDLVPYAQNSRTHSESQVAQIAASITTFGFCNPVLMDGDKGILCGHGRVMAAQELGLKKIPCIKLDHLSEAEKKAFIIADNKLAENAGWDMDMLKTEMESLQGMNFDLSIMGFDPDEMADIFADNNPGLTDPDEVPDIPVKPTSKESDVWLLGKHRLMCGDSTSIKQAKALMAGVNAGMVFTDPPYNVDYSGRGQNDLGKIKNDAMSEDDFEQFCRDFFAVYNAVMKPLATIYVCHPDSQTAPKMAFEKTFAEQFKKSSTIIWMKQSAGMGWQDYRCQHEPILYGWKPSGSGKHFFIADRTKTTIWNIGRDAQSSYVHPTQKPVALPQEAITNSSKGEDCVLDLFGGSGSTLIACEITGRVNRSMELDPKYCDVIVKRWQNFTGKKAILESTGKPFKQIKQ